MQQRLTLDAQERIIIGKKVKTLRKLGLIPGNVFGQNNPSESVSIDVKEFQKVYGQAGETGLVDLKIGEEKTKPVLIRTLQHHALTDNILHVDFYQVNLKEKVTVPVPLVLIGDEPEKVHTGDAIVLQTLSEVEIEALPTDLIDQIEVNISTLKEIDDSITVGSLNYNRETITVLAGPEELVVKLAPAVSQEMEELLEEQQAEQAASAEGEAAEEGAGEAGEGESTDESTETSGGEEPKKEETQE